MTDQFINESLTSLDRLVINSDWATLATVNGYPLVTIFWNIFLLIIPFFLLKFLFKYWRKTKFKKLLQKIIGLLSGFLWLMFIPNTAYIIVDIRHISGFCPSSFYRVCINNSWMIIFFFIYGVVGWLAFIFLLRQAKELIIKIWNKKIANWFIALVIPIIALGVMLGLIERWNSWEVFFHPLKIVNSALTYLTNSIYFVNWLVFTIGLYILYYFGDKLFRKTLD